MDFIGEYQNCQILRNLAADYSKNGYRLPTSNEWQYAYLAGQNPTITSGYYWSTGLIENYAWYSGNSNNSIHPVAGKQPNNWNLYDMAGNVSEWVWGSSIADTWALICGGSFDLGIADQKYSSVYNTPKTAHFNTGFRVVRKAADITTSVPTAGCLPSSVTGGCGAYISPSGKYHQHFWEGGHTQFRINTWNPPCEVTATVDINSGDLGTWAGVPKDSICGQVMSWARWAVNSDKWICGAVTNAYNAQNQVLVNWIDHKAIQVSRNKAASGWDRNSNDPGDFWVSGGPCGNYEDVNGNWVSAGSCTETKPQARFAPAQVSSSQQVNVYSVQGRLLGIWKRANISANHAILPTGTYIIRSTAQQQNAAVRIVSGS